MSQAGAKTAPFDWRNAYLQVLFETDRNQLSRRIAEAEQALFLRERELFCVPNEKAEREAVNNALHALSALKICMGLQNPRLAA